MLVGVPAAIDSLERRVALTPSAVPLLKKAGLTLLVQKGAGQPAGFSDDAYLQQGAALAENRRELFAKADVVAYVHGPQHAVPVRNAESNASDLELLRPGQVIAGLLNPLGAPQIMQELAARHVTALALELLPRISRAQPMDALTSMAAIAGYKAVLDAAVALPRFFPLMMTAAGTIPPARVLVLGAGVAGLQAIGTARRLGAVVEAYDVRPAVREEVESLGAKFLELPLSAEQARGQGGYAQAMDEDFLRRQRELLSVAVANADVVISTAAVPGKPAPRLIDVAALARMQPGSVIVDLAAETGGNCELTQPDRTVVAHGVTIMGPCRLAATVPQHASQMYARNLVAFLAYWVKDGQLALRLDDEIIRETLVTHAGQIVQPLVRDRCASASQPPRSA